MADTKAYVQDTRNEHGKRIAAEAKEREDLKEQYKDEYKTHSMQISRDDIDRLCGVIKKHPNAGRFKALVDFMQGDKGFWTEELTLNIVDSDEQYDDYVNVHESKREQIEALEAKLESLKQI